MNAPTDPLPSITISPPLAPESEADKVSQTVFTPPKVGQMSNYDSSDDGGLDGLVPSARPIPTFQPAQKSKTKPRINVYQGNSDGRLEVQSNWDRDKFHKLHLDLHLHRHHHHRDHLPQQPEHDEEAPGFNYNRDHDKMHKLHLKLHQPRHSSLSSERRPEVGSDGIDSPVVFRTTVPVLKYHEHLECITHPRLTQKEYEHRILTRE